jgi:hypothetical protein
MQMKKLMVGVGLMMFITSPLFGKMLKKSSETSDVHAVKPQEEAAPEVKMKRVCAPKNSEEVQELSDETAQNNKPTTELASQEEQEVATSKTCKSTMPDSSDCMDCMDQEMMTPMSQKRSCNSMNAASCDMEMMMPEDMENLLRALVLLIDVDFLKKMVVVDVDFHRDDARMIDSILMRYTHNPEQAEEMLSMVAQKYMDEHGDAVVCSLLKNCNMADAELLARMVMPIIQKALMGQFLNAMHRCIMHKSMKLSEITAH